MKTSLFVIWFCGGENYHQYFCICIYLSESFTSQPDICKYKPFAVSWPAKCIQLGLHVRQHQRWKEDGEISDKEVTDS